MPAGAGVATTELLDLIAATRRHLPKKTLNNTLKYQNYEVLGYLMAKGRYEVGGGRGVQETVRIDESGTARHVSAYEERVLGQVDTLQSMGVDFVHADDYWMLSSIELGQNRSTDEEIVNIVEAKRAACFESLGNLLEDSFFGTPSATNLKLPWGLKYWIVNRAAAGAGFGGLAATGFTTVGGINPTTYSRWANYAAGGTAYYEDVNSTFVKTCRTARRKINFKAPKRIDMGLTPDQKLRIYANDTTISKLEERAEAQATEGMRFDLMTAQDQVLLGRLPVQYIPALDADTVYPVYFVNMATFKVRLMKGRVLAEREPMYRASQHDVAINFVDLSYLYWCNNRRLNAVVHQ